jgi:hypothetical protein
MEILYVGIHNALTLTYMEAILVCSANVHVFVDIKLYDTCGGYLYRVRFLLWALY